MKKEDVSQTIRIADLAADTGWTDRHLRDLAARQYFPQSSEGRYKFRPALRGIVRYFKELLEKKNNPNTTALAEAKIEHTKLKTEILRVDLGKHVLKSEIGPALHNFSANQKRLLVYQLEKELPPRLVGLDAAAIRVEMQNVVNEICDIIRRDARKWLEAPPE
jgi:hypothetical protein